MSGDDYQNRDSGDESDAVDQAPSAADPELTAKQLVAKRSYGVKRETFWKNVLADPVGRQELWAIIGVEAHAFELKFGCGPNGSPQPEASWQSLGEQLLGQRVFQTLQQIDFEGCWLMLCEHDGRFKKPAESKRRSRS
jgi:hypothetical protein